MLEQKTRSFAFELLVRSLEAQKPQSQGLAIENLGSGIGIWDSFTQNPGSWIPGSQIADSWYQFLTNIEKKKNK